MTKAKDVSKNKGGRPSDFKQGYIGLAYNYALLGAIDRDLAAYFNTTETTITTWKKKYPEFLLSLNEGKAKADAQVANRLFKRAMGYEHKEVDIKMFQGEIIKTEIIKHYAPDTTACIFWLKNRQPKLWRDKQEIDHTTGGEKITLIERVIKADDK